MEAGGDVFVTKLNATGTALVYSTYIGGSGYEVGQWHSGGWERQRLCDGIHLVHQLPCYTGGFPDDEWRQGDVFVTKLNATGTALVYSTYIGGSAIVIMAMP
jgi:hypothetical protein